MATQNIKYVKKCKKIFFSQIIGGAMAPFGQGVATPMYVNVPGNKKVATSGAKKLLLMTIKLL